MALLNIASLVQNRKALLAIAVVVPLVGAAVAVPALMSGDSEPESSPSPAPIAQPAVAPATEPELATAAPDVAAEESEDAVAERGPHEGGDLDVAVGLRFQRYPVGAAIRATVDVLNNSLDAVFLPAPSEPQPTLVVVVLDDEGNTVRRVVEETEEPTPRRMRRLDSGESTRFKIDVLTRDETALEPGTYHVVASYESHDGWRRTGLDVWSAPQGVRRSDRVTFEVIADE